MISTPFAVGLTLLVPAGISFIVDKVKQGAGDKWAVVLSFLGGSTIIALRLGLINF